MKGMIFDIQHYAVHDGPGIRTIVYFKGCPLRCLWCANPESQNPGPELWHRSLRCRACGRCLTACPKHAVSEGPVFDRALCAACADRPCVETCWEDALRSVGRPLSVEEVMGPVAADLGFYRNSGGGVTFSGGEPFAQPDFLRALLEACRKQGIHTAVETCGHVAPRALLEMEPLVDLFLYDLKVVDPAAHKRLTGADNRLILENLQALCAVAADRVTIRVPLIPGCTDGEDNLEAIADLAVGLGVRRVDLEPYHALGTDKYRGLGRQYALEDLPASVPPERLKAAVTVFTRRRLECEVA